VKEIGLLIFKNYEPKCRGLLVSPEHGRPGAKVRGAKKKENPPGKSGNQPATNH
jgi:hypothetical protein